jgi:hypothetical protein
MKSSKVNLAWAAGFFDGEGSTCCSNNNGHRHTRLQLSIGQKNYKNDTADTLVRFKNIFKCGKIYKKNIIGKEINQKQFYVTIATDVKKIIKLMYPFLSKAKKEQYKNAVKLYIKGLKKIGKKFGQTNKKPVIQLTLSGKFIKKWSSLSEARKILHLSHIDQVCYNKRHSAGGYKWKYLF